MQTFQILHISDLHISTKDGFDRAVVLEPLIKRIKKDTKSGKNKPEIVVVTGDVAHSGVEEEYNEAKKFFDDLLVVLKLAKERLFIVPGNHDVKHKKYRPTEIPSYKNMTELNKELENEDYRDDLLKGMDDYYKFVEDNYSHLESEHGRLVPFVKSYSADCGKQIGIVGLNSAWMCRKSPDEKEIAIGEYQIRNAMKELAKNEKPDVVINMFHHPMYWLWPVDRRICKRYFEHSIIVAGHIHDAEAGCGKDLQGYSCEFYAGASYTGSGSPAFNRFQYITVDWKTSSIRLDFRKYDIEERRWVLEGEKGCDGTESFDVPWLGSKDKKKVISLPEIPSLYKEWISDRCKRMDIEKLAEKEKVIQVSLPEIFIPLYAYPPGSKTKGKGSSRNHLREEKEGLMDMHEKEKKLPDIEELIAENEYLLIEGDPGTGKTTLLKHLSYTIVNDMNRRGMDDYLPVLIYLKDLNAFFEGNAMSASLSTAESVLEYYCKNNGLDLDVINVYCKAKKAIFLFDGLDELHPRYRKILAASFKDFSLHNKGNKVVMSGRPHGMDEAVIERFGDGHIKIQTLTMEQVELFITGWFDHVYEEGSFTGGKTAVQMISEIREHQNVAQLIETPLMLTAICILYHDGKELPGQRAELYKKFINNLLYRRFDEPERAYNFLKALAFRMHSEGTRGIDKQHAVEVIETVFISGERPSREVCNQLFEDIEPKCGLLNLEDGQYTFRHLTFQEFLAAACIVDKETDYSDAVKTYWNKDWYREVLELLVGILSIENRAWANKIVEEVLKKPDGKPYKKWRLASKCILDIHKDRREPSVLAVATKKLASIIKADVSPDVLAGAGETLGWLGDTRDLKEFVHIKGGEYELQDLGKTNIKAFEMGKYTVTNIWFEEFVMKDGYKTPEYWSEEGRKWLEHSKEQYPRYWYEQKWKCPNAPVVGVCWYEADAFTRWLTIISDKYNYRLPSEEEWQAAAAGFERRDYPWGPWENNRCNTWELNIRKTSPVGVFGKGNTPEGVADLSGNVWEWTDSWYDKDKDSKVLRGGSWVSHHRDARCANRSWVLPDTRYDLIGFRCVRTLR